MSINLKLMLFLAQKIKMLFASLALNFFSFDNLDSINEIIFMTLFFLILEMTSPRFSVEKILKKLSSTKIFPGIYSIKLLFIIMKLVLNGSFISWLNIMKFWFFDLICEWIWLNDSVVKSIKDFFKVSFKFCLLVWGREKIEAVAITRFEFLVDFSNISCEISRGWFG